MTPAAAEVNTPNAQILSQIILQSKETEISEN